MHRATKNARPTGANGTVGAGAQEAAAGPSATISPRGISVQPAALPVEYDGAALTDAERVELRRARADERRSRQAAARQHSRQMGGAL